MNQLTFHSETLVAYSYDWWQFTVVIKGKLIFNDYSYSNMARKHQCEVRNILREMGREIYLEVEVPKGLQSEDFKLILDNFYLKMFTIEAELKNQKIRNKEDRLASIEKIKEDIKKTKKLGFKNTQKIKDLQTKAEKDYVDFLEREKEKREEKKAAARKKLPNSVQLLLKIKDN